MLQLPAASRPRSVVTRPTKTDENAPPAQTGVRLKPSLNNIANAAANGKPVVAGKQSVAAKAAGTGGILGAKRAAFGNVTNRVCLVEM